MRLITENICGATLTPISSRPYAILPGQVLSSDIREYLYPIETDITWFKPQFIVAGETPGRYEVG
jgi:hypothetical protein